jgi:hypothetical protein
MPKVDHRAKLAELKALRQAGKKAFESYQVEDADNLYDEVDEAGYKKIVRERLNQDDFVVDDNGEGYADDGREDWDRVRQYESDSEGEGLPARFNGADFEAQQKRVSKMNRPSEMPTTAASANTLPKALAKPSPSPRYKTSVQHSNNPLG